MEKARATLSSTLAWKIPWMEEPGRLQFIGFRRVGHDWVTSLSLFTFMHWRRKWQLTPVFLPGESQGQRSLVGCCLWGCRIRHDWSDLAAAAHMSVNCMLLSVPRIFCHPYLSSELLTPCFLLKSLGCPSRIDAPLWASHSLCASCCHGLIALLQSSLFVVVFICCQLQLVLRAPLCSHMAPGLRQLFSGWSTSAPQPSPKEMSSSH